MTNWRQHVEPFSRPVFFLWSRLTRGKTLGVRGMAVDGEGRVLLVKHTYLAGWWLPGGGVDKGETTQAAVVRELREEAGLIARGEPILLSVHSNERFFPGDHVVVFRLDDFDMGERTSHGEIAEIGWFHPDALPDETHRATRTRIEEVFKGRAVDVFW